MHTPARRMATSVLVISVDFQVFPFRLDRFIASTVIDDAGKARHYHILIHQHAYRHQRR